MSHLRDCQKCGDEFDLKSPSKRKVGGLINECPECSQEKEPKAFAVLNISKEDDKETAVKIIRRAKKSEGELIEEVMRVFRFECTLVKVENEYVYFYVDKKDLEEE